MQMITNFILREDGAAAIEYGLLAALVSVALVATLSAVGTSLSARIQLVSDNLS